MNNKTNKKGKTVADTKFTPGPWKVRYLIDQIYIEACNQRKNVVARVVIIMKGKADESNVADFHLIAAAPDMYEALKEINKVASEEKCIEDMMYIASLALKTLAKAEGKTK